MSTILAFGELLWDILPNKTLLGGAPFNFAFRTQNLGDPSLFASCVGVDELGKRALSRVRELGMDASLIQQSTSYPTGTVNVRFDADKAPDFVINTGVAFDHITLNDELLQAARNADCLCFGTLIQREQHSRMTLQNLIATASKAIKFLDINLRKNCFSKETIRYSLEQANILKLNDDEARLLSGILGLTDMPCPAFCRAIADRFHLDYVVVTFGEYGAHAQSSLGEQVYVPGYRIKVVDSVGSGDAFSAAFVHNLLQSHSLQRACEQGNALGALVASTHGATEVISQKEIEKLLHSDVPRAVHPQFK